MAILLVSAPFGKNALAPSTTVDWMLPPSAPISVEFSMGRETTAKYLGKEEVMTRRTRFSTSSFSPTSSAVCVALFIILFINYLKCFMTRLTCFRTSKFSHDFKSSMCCIVYYFIYYLFIAFSSAKFRI